VDATAEPAACDEKGVKVERRLKFDSGANGGQGASEAPASVTSGLNVPSAALKQTADPTLAPSTSATRGSDLGFWFCCVLYVIWHIFVFLVSTWRMTPLESYHLSSMQLAAIKGAAIAAAVLAPLKLMLALLRSRRAAARHPKAAPKEAGQPAPTGRCAVDSTGI
jgi:hypothetical protein